MSKLSGTILVLAGVALAAYTLSSRHHAGAGSAAPQPGGAGKATAVPNASDPPNGQAKLASAAQLFSLPAPWQAPTTSVAPPKAAEPRPTGKFIPPQAVRIAEAPPRVPVDQQKPASAPPLDHAGLTREIQRHLKRVGCYGGAVTGVWSPSVRRAMKAFTDRVNATLPIEQPDHVLLAMVQSHQHVACSAACPAGQGLADDGRCLPNALVARARKQPAPARQPPPVPARAPDDGAGPPAAVVSAPTVRASPADGRMSLAGPPSVNAPDRAKAGPRRGQPPTQARSARPSRYVETRARERRRDARAYYSGPAGFPWWAIRAFTQ